MFLPPSMFKSGIDKRKKTTGDTNEIHEHKVEHNISKSKVENSEVVHDKETEGRRLL